MNAHPEFRRGEGDGNVGLHGCPERLPRIGVKSRGYVDGNAPGALAVYEFYELLVKPFHLPVEPGTEDGVDYDFRILYPGKLSAELPYVGFDLEKRVEVRFRVTPVAFLFLCDVDAYLFSRGNKMARDYETVPCVVSGAADDRHLLCGRTLGEDDRRHGSSGVLHKHDARNSEFLNRPSVYFP